MERERNILIGGDVIVRLECITKLMCVLMTVWTHECYIVI